MFQVTLFSLPVASVVQRAVQSGLAFCLGFGIFCMVVSSSTPEIRVRKVTEKIETFRAHSDDFDTIFVGTSRTARQVIPAVFDHAMAELGTPTRTFNLGFEGLRPPEDWFVLDRALVGRTKPLKFLVMECGPILTNMPEEDKWTTRSILTHDAKRLGVYWRQIWAGSMDRSPGSLPKLKEIWSRFRAFVVHFRHYIWNHARISEGSRQVTALITGIPAKQNSDPVPADGYYLRETEWDKLEGKELEKYLADLARQKAKLPAPFFADAVSQAEWMAWKTRAEQLGAQLVLVSPPYLKPKNFMPKNSAGIIIIDYTDPNAYPELYAVKNRRDSGHLNDHGSALYTRSLAERLTAARQSRP
jgi:hypothetical protein